jgi:hypothetical protein
MSGFNGRKDSDEFKGIKLTERRHDNYQTLRGRTVLLTFGNSTVAGVLEGLSEDGDIIVGRFCDSEVYPNGDTVYFLNEGPYIITPNGTSVGVHPLRKGYMEDYIEKGNVFEKEKKAKSD